VHYFQASTRNIQHLPIAPKAPQSTRINNYNCCIGKFDLASATIVKAIEAVPVKERFSYYYFWKIQSILFSRLEKYPQALESIETAIKLEPQDRILLNEKATILSSQKQYAAAIKIYDSMISQQAEAYVYVNRGLARSYSGDKQGAIADYERAIKINPQYAQAYENRGVAKSGLGNNQGAIIDLSKAAELFRQQGQMDSYQRAMGLIATLKGS
jgi:tetratricopeptide (TPR) repeat protein